jgi:two-component system chemotaxis response regulator CheY
MPQVSVFLIADVNSPMQRTIRSMLLECGFSEIHEADNGAAALQKLKAGNFDFFISDTQLPVLDGFQLLTAIRSDPQLQDLPVLLVTADANVESVVHAAQQGASGYVVKPFTRATLEEKIAVICKKLHLPAPSTCIAEAIER